MRGLSITKGRVVSLKWRNSTVSTLTEWLLFSLQVVSDSCDPMDSHPPGSSVHGISQSRILEWVAISFFWGSSWPRVQTCISCIGRWILYRSAVGKQLYDCVVVGSLSCVWLFATPWAAARQAFLSFTISRSLLKLMSIDLVMPSNYLILCCPLLTTNVTSRHHVPLYW